MKKAAYAKLLTPAERAGALKLGAALVCADNGIKASDIDSTMKSAAGVSPGGVAKAIATVAVLTGVPLGVAAHVIDRKVTARRRKELELQENIKYYRQATQGLEAGLATPEAV